MIELLEILKEARRACEVLPQYLEPHNKQQIAENFIALQVAVYNILGEEAIILANLKWKKDSARESSRKGMQEILKGETERICSTHEYNTQTVQNLLFEKNINEFEEEINVTDVIIEYVYHYWTLE